MSAPYRLDCGNPECINAGQMSSDAESGYLQHKCRGCCTPKVNERERAFRDAINAVCREHGAELEVTDDGQSYGMQCGVLRVTMMSVWEGDVLAKDFCQFNW